MPAPMAYSRQTKTHWTKTTYGCGLVVRTSALGQQTFPDLCPIYSLQVTTMWVNPAMVNSALLGQLSLLSLQGQ